MEICCHKSNIALESSLLNEMGPGAIQSASKCVHSEYHIEAKNLKLIFKDNFKPNQTNGSNLNDNKSK